MIWLGPITVVVVVLGLTQVLLRSAQPAEPLMILAAALLVGWLVLERRRFVRSGQPSTTTALVVVLLTLTVGYGVGSWSTEVQVRPLEVGGEQWVLYGLGIVGVAVGGLICAARRQGAVSGRVLSAPSLAAFPLRVVAAIGVIFALVNFALNGVPALAGNVDAVRFGGSQSAIARTTVFYIGVLEFAAVALAIKAALLRNRGDFLTLLIVFLTLAGTGARAFIAISLLSMAVVYVEVQRPRLRTLVAVAVAGIVALGAVGQLRLGDSDYDRQRQTYLAARGFDNPLGAALASAQTGPWVFDRTRSEVVPRGDFLNGRFFISDIGVVLPGAVRAELPLLQEQSDRWLTRALGTDPSRVGGLPPTVFGGFYLDGGAPGVLFGSLLLGASIVASHRFALARGTVGSAVIFGYWVAYSMLSAYSYISLKPTVLVVLGLAVWVHRREMRARGGRASSAARASKAISGTF